MVKLVAIYRKPENTDTFDEHYFNVHTPLAEKMPGLRKLEVNKVYGAPMGESNLHLLAEMYFDNKEDLNAAMTSPEGKAAARDLMGFAGKIVSMHFAEVL
ncbi:ethyl tert-butyl ether degradation protein EthD [Aneurinibacillus migulanus]|uniref:Ethyl tert-butyl ether degradation protein EthD n=1 Tax=Aneurinibacillus migulanus TaxID=47500 RepID=A0A0D1Y3F9_ANEMI|nr:EthD family reductase [Aneurinibacillus migulanus]KIV53832.1 ethyl tert-butyl ether degradation protein EthD [Aneurinibacillus migulanus]KIV58786.1 ethyl tert-butyl ether degradation protein EthD [Aneurinibacillus migulanus]KON96477.1 ethyl tert-butyl ether degradation protein EthD [Aneurinibacillus migulanus]KPD08181.1 ethyl tert-butyl ether degradation protein EthD [Aneurinibacillus migulanus]MCP1357069.1 EthD family reductase [Aneurinibacillus migulanus]